MPRVRPAHDRAKGVLKDVYQQAVAKRSFDAYFVRAKRPSPAGAGGLAVSASL